MIFLCYFHCNPLFLTNVIKSPWKSHEVRLGSSLKYGLLDRVVLAAGWDQLRLLG